MTAVFAGFRGAASGLRWIELLFLSFSTLSGVARANADDERIALPRFERLRKNTEFLFVRIDFIKRRLFPIQGEIEK